MLGFALVAYLVECAKVCNILECGPRERSGPEDLLTKIVHFWPLGGKISEPQMHST